MVRAVELCAAVALCKRCVSAGIVARSLFGTYLEFTNPASAKPRAVGPCLLPPGPVRFDRTMGGPLGISMRLSTLLAAARALADDVLLTT